MLSTYAMPYHTMLFLMSCHAILMPCHAILTPCYTHAVPYHAILNQSIPMPCYYTPCHIMLLHAMLYHIHNSWCYPTHRLTNSLAATSFWKETIPIKVTPGSTIHTGEHLAQGLTLPSVFQNCKLTLSIHIPIQMACFILLMQAVFLDRLRHLHSCILCPLPWETP